MPSPHEPGALLEVRGETWRLIRAQHFETCAVLTLEGHDRSNAGDRLRVIDPFDRPRAIANRKLRRRSRRAVIASALAAITTARDASRLWTAADAAIELWPHQLEPALGVIGGATRLLLADAVGLGKTIQAGLIVAELIERGWIEHALIVCPAGLRDTWARELRDRFGINAIVIDQAALAERIASLPPGVSPWSGHAVAIASIDFVKREEVLAAIDHEPIDLVIADEAHHLSPGTDRGAAISRIASRAPWCVFVSATPHSGDRAAFDYLTSLGDTGEPIAIFRRQRGDVGLVVSRRARVLGVKPTHEEASLLTAIEAYARAIWIARGRGDHAVRLVAMTMARRASSSRAAIERTLTRRLALIANTGVEPAQSLLPWEDADLSDQVEPDAMLSARGLESIDEERKALEHLIALAGRCSASSKFCRLQRLLGIAREPAVIFTEYRDTLDAIVAALPASSRRVGVIHGGLPTEQRRAAVDAFNDGRIDVLVATDAAGEGLNLHHRCRLVIDVELPWNPLRLEQRIGRVDRIGQQRTVHAIRLFHPGTIESAVLEHLRGRHHRADRDVAAALFDGTSADPDEPAIRSLVVAAAKDEARRLERQRQLAPLKRSRARIWTFRRGRRASRLVALHRITAVNDAGYVVSEWLQASRIQLAANPEDHRRWRQLIAGLDSIVRLMPDAFALARASTSAKATVDKPARQAQSDSFERRVGVIRARLKRERIVRYQRSLFDRRADADAAARQAVADRLDAALCRTLRSVTSPIAIDAMRVDLVAAWPERRR
jgi:superfamily II DNA or RNA helicase